MGCISVDQLNQGMVLSDDVLDINRKLLLTKGKTITPKHIRIFKLWGITEVNVFGKNEKKNETEPWINPELRKKIEDRTKRIFKNVDLDYPAAKEIFKLSVSYRCHNCGSDTHETQSLAEYDNSVKSLRPDVVEKIKSTEIKLPELPSTVVEINEIVADPMASANDVAEVVNKSPSLTALLLKITNSAFYGFPSKIDNISRAVTLIGSKQIASLALGVSMMHSFKDIPKAIVDMEAFLKHSLACGLISRILSAYKNIRQTEQMFVSGLLHDIGRLILYKDFPHESKLYFKLAMESDKSLYSVERIHIGYSHARIGKHLINAWKLPIVLENNVVFHHRPSDAPDQKKAAIIHLADIIVNGLGLGTSGERIIPQMDCKALENIDMPFKILNKVVQQAIHQLASLESFFNGQN
jgi:HD-like signal output (HDOD) protein